MLKAWHSAAEWAAPGAAFVRVHQSLEERAIGKGSAPWATSPAGKGNVRAVPRAGGTR